jgi:hypothetical protein
MAYPAYEDNGGIFTGTDYNVVVDCPATVNANDILVAQLLDADDDTFSPPDGSWFPLYNCVHNNASAGWFWKRADGTEDGASITFTSVLDSGAGVYGVIHRISGCVTTGLPFEISFGRTPTTQTDAPATHAIRTRGATRLAVSFITAEDDGAITGWSNFTEEANLSSTVGGDARLMCGSQQIASASNISTDTLSNVASEYTAVLTLAFSDEAVGVDTYDSGGTGSLPDGSDPTYDDLGVWEAATDNALGASEFLYCYDSQIHTDYVNINGATQTTSYRFRRLLSSPGCATPFDGKYDTGAIFYSTAGPAFIAGEAQSEIVNVSVKMVINDSGDWPVFRCGGGTDNPAKIFGCIAYDSVNNGAGQANGFDAYSLPQGCLNSCIAINNDGHGFDLDQASTVALNCTAVNNGAYGFYSISNNGTAFSCYSSNNTSGDYSTSWSTASALYLSKDSSGSSQVTYTYDSYGLITEEQTAGKNPYNDISGTFDYNFIFNGTSAHPYFYSDIRGKRRKTPETADTAWPIGANIPERVKTYDSGGTTDEHDTQDSNQLLYSGATLAYGQAITLSQAVYARNIGFKFSKTGSPTGTVYFKVYNATGTVGTNAKPTGTAVATTSIDVSYIGSTVFYLSFSEPVLLSAGDYCLVVEFSGGNASNYITVGYDSSTSGHSGNACSSTDLATPTWSNESADCRFYFNRVDYDDLGVWEAATDNALTCIHYLDCFDSQDHNDGGCMMSGATGVHEGCYRGVRSAAGCATPFAGKSSTGAAFYQTATNWIFSATTEDYIRFENFSCKNTRATTIWCLSMTDTTVKAIGIVCHDVTSSGSIAYGLGSTGTCYACICRDMEGQDTDSSSYGIINNSVVVCCTSVLSTLTQASSGTADGYRVNGTLAKFISLYAADNDDEDYNDTISPVFAEYIVTKDATGTSQETIAYDSDGLITGANTSGINPSLYAYSQSIPFLYNGVDCPEALALKDITGKTRPFPEIPLYPWGIGANEPVDAGAPGVFMPRTIFIF